MGGQVALLGFQVTVLLFSLACHTSRGCGKIPSEHHNYSCAATNCNGARACACASNARDAGYGGHAVGPTRESVPRGSPLRVRRPGRLPRGEPSFGVVAQQETRQEVGRDQSGRG